MTRPSRTFNDNTTPQSIATDSTIPQGVNPTGRNTSPQIIDTTPPAESNTTPQAPSNPRGTPPPVDE